MFWEILGIEPTFDKKAITMAYRTKLVQTNPEDKPEEFKQLREAYEMALEYAQKGFVEETPVEKWEHKLSDLYNDFSKRRDVSCWEELLSEDICFSLDSKGQIEEALLKFFMNNYFIAHEVWLFLDSRFAFRERYDELCENYPKEFIDYIIINGINYEDSLPQMMFEPGKDGQVCQNYLNLYNKIRNSDEEQIKELYQQLNALPEKHPFGKASYLNYCVTNGDTTKVSELEALVEKWGYDRRLSSTLVNCYLTYTSEFAKGEEVCRKALEKASEDVHLHWLLANLLAKQEKYSDAIATINDTMKLVGGDQRQLAQLDEKRRELNNFVIENGLKKYELNSDDIQNKLDLAWAYLQNDNSEASEKYASEIQKGEIDDFDYYNLNSNIDFALERIDAGLEKLDCLIEVIENLPADSEKNIKRKKRLAEMYGRKGYFLSVNNHQKEGMDAYLKAAEISPNDAEILTQIAQIAYHFKDYEKCVEYCRQINKVKPDAYHAYLLASHANYEMGNDSAAFNDVNTAIDLYGSDLDCYVMKLRILVRNNAKDASKELYDFLVENQCGEELNVKILGGNIAEFFDDDAQKALEIYEQAIKQLENGEYCYHGENLYFRYCVLLCRSFNTGDSNEIDKRLAIVDKGLALNNDHYGLNDYKGWLLNKAKRFDEALEVYLKLEKYENHSPEIEYQIGRIYYEDLDKNIDKAVEYFLKAYHGGDEACYFYLSYCYYYMEDYDNSEKFAMLLRESEEKHNNVDIDSYYRMSYIYERRGQYQQALEANEKAIENARKLNSKLDAYYNHKVRLYRLMKQPEKALETLDYMIHTLEIKYGEDVMTEIYFQFGMFDKAKELIQRRLKFNSTANKSKAASDLVTLYRLTDHPSKAKFSLLNYAEVMNKDEFDDANASLQTFNGKYKKVVDIQLKRLERRKQEGGTLCYCYIKVAEAYDLCDDKEKAYEYANLALQAYEKERSRYDTNKGVDYIHMARILICLDRLDEASEYIEKARKSGCGNCKYWSCKDGDNMEIAILIKKGEYDKALAACEENIKKWTDDCDFIDLKAVCENKKGNKK